MTSFFVGFGLFVLTILGVWGLWVRRNRWWVRYNWQFQWDWEWQKFDEEREVCYLLGWCATGQHVGRKNPLKDTTDCPGVTPERAPGGGKLCDCSCHIKIERMEVKKSRFARRPKRS